MIRKGTYFVDRFDNSLCLTLADSSVDDDGNEMVSSIQLSPSKTGPHASIGKPGFKFECAKQWFRPIDQKKARAWHVALRLRGANMKRRRFRKGQYVRVVGGGQVGIVLEKQQGDTYVLIGWIDLPYPVPQWIDKQHLVLERRKYARVLHVAKRLGG